MSSGSDWHPDEGLLNPLAFPPMVLLGSGKVPSRWGELDSRKRVLVTVSSRCNAADQEVGGYRLQKTDCKRSPIQNSHVKPDIEFFSL